VDSVAQAPVADFVMSASLALHARWHGGRRLPDSRDYDHIADGILSAPFKNLQSIDIGLDGSEEIGPYGCPITSHP
jgi:hypothetical protein